MATRDECQRVKVIYHGRVQGVGFRYTAQSIAERHGVTGFVRNLANGCVELLAEGSRDAVDGTLMGIDQAMSRGITDRTIERSEPTGGFDRFEIRF